MSTGTYEIVLIVVKHYVYCISSMSWQQTALSHSLKARKGVCAVEALAASLKCLHLSANQMTIMSRPDRACLLEPGWERF